MSRCLSCNVILTPYEDSIRSSNNDELVQLCQYCLPPVSDSLTSLKDNGYYGNEELLEIHDNITLSEN
jgi:hypothetical protein